MKAKGSGKSQKKRRGFGKLKLAFGDALPEDIILSVFQQCGENVKKAEAQLLELTGQTPAAAPASLVEVSNEETKAVEGAGSSSRQRSEEASEPLALLQEMFPSLDRRTIEAALEANGGGIEAATEVLVTMEDSAAVTENPWEWEEGGEGAGQWGESIATKAGHDGGSDDASEGLGVWGQAAAKATPPPAIMVRGGNGHSDAETSPTDVTLKATSPVESRKLSQKERNRIMEMLSAMFPDASKTKIKKTLAACQWDAEVAADALSAEAPASAPSGPGARAWSRQPPSSSRSPPGNEPRIAASQPAPQGSSGAEESEGATTATSSLPAFHPVLTSWPSLNSAQPQATKKEEEERRKQEALANLLELFPTLDHDVVSSIASQMQDVTSAIQALHSMYPKEVEAALQQRQQLYNDEQLARRLTGEKSITELLVGWGWGDRPDSVTSSYVAAEEQPRHFIQVTSSGAIKPSTAGLEAKATEERTKPPSFIATETDDITAVARGLAAQVGGNYQELYNYLRMPNSDIVAQIHRYQRSIATSKAKREHGAIHHYIQKLKELRAVQKAQTIHSGRLLFHAMNKGTLKDLASGDGSGKRGMLEFDFHTLHADEAVMALRDILAQCRARRRHRFRIITGKGHGSTGGSTLIPAVRKALDEEAVANATSTVSYMPLTEEQRAKLPRDASVMSTSAATLSYSFNGAAFTVQLL